MEKGASDYTEKKHIAWIFYRSYLVIEILITNSYDIDDICTYYLSVTTVLSEHEKKNHPEIRDDFFG